MELLILVLYWADDDGRNSYHYPGMAPVSSAGVGDTLLKRGHYQPRSSLCLGHNQSVRLGEEVASLSELKIANLLMTTQSGQGDLYKSAHPQCMNRYTPGVALYTLYSKPSPTEERPDRERITRSYGKVCYILWCQLG